MKSILFRMIVAAAQAETNTGECKEMLQGYLTGQLSSALGAYQVEALRRKFKSFTDVIEKSMREFKENIETKLKKTSKVFQNKNMEYNEEKLFHNYFT